MITTIGLFTHSLADGAALGTSTFCKFYFSPFIVSARSEKKSSNKNARTVLIYLQVDGQPVDPNQPIAATATLPSDGQPIQPGTPTIRKPLTRSEAKRIREQEEKLRDHKPSSPYPWVQVYEGWGSKRKAKVKETWQDENRYHL